MTALILFIVVLGFLVIVHELGHFWAAKLSRVKVTEFGVGLPPKVYGYQPKNSEVEYSLNWLPIGGFVKIFGENYEDLDVKDPDYDRAFSRASKFSQFFILFGGVFMNFIAAILLFSLAAWSGSIVPVESVNDRDAFIVASIAPGSPADQSALEVGNEIVSIADGEKVLAGQLLVSESFSELIQNSDSQIVLETKSKQTSTTTNTVTITPQTGLLANQIDVKAIGVYADSFKYERANFIDGINQGIDQSVDGILLITKSFGDLLLSVFNGQGKETLSNLAGPVGIAQLSAQAYDLGFGQLFGFAAFLSLNLVVLNLLPLPALDGGRILFVLIEAIKGSPLNPKFASYANLAGFGLLLLLMIAITIQDVSRIL